MMVQERADLSVGGDKPLQPRAYRMTGSPQVEPRDVFTPKETGEPMSEPDVWYMLFDQTPIAIRWGFTLVTGGAFWLAAALYRRQKNQQERVERQLHARVDRLERRLDTRMDQMARLLTEIAANTRRSPEPMSGDGWANK